MTARQVATGFVVVVLAAGAFYFFRNLEHPDAGKAANVAEEPAGGRTQAQEPSSEAPPLATTPGDPLQPGISEQPDIPADSPHSGIKKMGERIKDAVLADGIAGDHETPGVDFTGLSQAQRRFFLEHATKINCGCGCGQDLLECRRDDATCPISPGIADSLLAVAKRQ
jgi:hypothetical protein